MRRDTEGQLVACGFQLYRVADGFAQPFVHIRTRNICAGQRHLRQQRVHRSNCFGSGGAFVDLNVSSFRVGGQEVFADLREVSLGAHRVAAVEQVVDDNQVHLAHLRLHKLVRRCVGKARSGGFHPRSVFGCLPVFGEHVWHIFVHLHVLHRCHQRGVDHGPFVHLKLVGLVLRPPV